MSLASRRWKHFTAMALIGDGVMAVIRPQNDALAWKHGPKPWKALMGELRNAPPSPAPSARCRSSAASGGHSIRKVED